MLILAVVDLHLHSIVADTFAEKHWARFSAITQDTASVLVSACVAITAAVDIFAFVAMIDFTAIFAGEVVVAIAMVTECQWNSIDGEIAITEEPAAMVACVVFINAMVAYETIVVIDGY